MRTGRLLKRWPETLICAAPLRAESLRCIEQLQEARPVCLAKGLENQIADGATGTHNKVTDLKIVPLSTAFGDWNAYPEQRFRLRLAGIRR